MRAVVVEHAGQGGAEAGQVRAAFRGQDAVGEGALVRGQVVVAVGVVVLEGHLDVGVLGDALVVERVGHHRVALAVDVPHHAGDAGVEEETALDVPVAFRFVKFADQANLQALVEIRGLAELGHQPAEVVSDLGEDFRVGVVGDRGALLADPLVLLEV